MKKRNIKSGKALLAFILSVSACLPAISQSCGELFQRANALRNSGSYEAAIRMYQQVKSCGDPSFKKDCDKWIKWCNNTIRDRQKAQSATSQLTVKKSSVDIPYYGGDSQVEIFSSNRWNAVVTDDEWCSTTVEKNRLIVQCREQNNSTRDRYTDITIKSGSLFRTLKVKQAGRPEYLEVASRKVSFPSSGSTETVGVETNANWQVTSYPDWCRIERDGSSIRISVMPNDKATDRDANIIIESPNKTVTVNICQGAGDEQLSFSRNDLTLPGDGDTYYVRVYTDADNWYVGDFPNWCNVQRVGADSLCIQVGKNIPNGESRTGSVQVRTDRQTAGINVFQNPRMPQDLIFPEGKIVGGRNVSLGISFGYALPMVSASAGGDYVGSAVNYSLCSSDENASYGSASGFSVGLFADIRLYRNIFLTPGISFQYFSYKNTFDRPTIYTENLVAGPYFYRGEMQNSYDESYKIALLNVPILASYRFKTGTTSHVALNLGPVLSYGLSARLKLSGNSDSESLLKYVAATGQVADGIETYTHHTAVSGTMNMYGKDVAWTTTYTQGNNQDIENTLKFKDSPLKRLNCGLQVGAAYEISGLSFGLAYTFMFTNMASQNYWNDKRWVILNPGNQAMSGYKQHIHSLEAKIAYTLRYINHKH